MAPEQINALPSAASTRGAPGGAVPTSDPGREGPPDDPRPPRFSHSRTRREPAGLEHGKLRRALHRGNLVARGQAQGGATYYQGATMAVRLDGRKCRGESLPGCQTQQADRSPIERPGARLA